jgi:peptide deformylase
MILPIHIYGHSILRKKCKNIQATYLGLDKLINDMFETMYNAHGIGISAPQVGLDAAIFVIDLSVYHEEDPSVPNIKKAFINPEIIEEYGDTETHNEGCLSIPGIREDVDRKSIIRVKYLDLEFQENIEELDGLYARVFQHEYDHLNGVLFIDHLSPLKKNILNRKLVKVEKGKFEDLYPTTLRK